MSSDCLFSVCLFGLSHVHLLTFFSNVLQQVRLPHLCFPFGVLVLTRQWRLVEFFAFGVPCPPPFSALYGLDSRFLSSLVPEHPGDLFWTRDKQNLAKTGVDGVL